MIPTISIIVPVFNAEQYLNDCLNSIQSQTFTDFEVILVDDGSTDRSFEILQRWSKIDSRFRGFHKENNGVSSARNEGLKHSTGDFICFVDADDQVSPTYLADLYEAIGDKADSSMCGFKKIDLLSREDCEIVPRKRIETLEENLLEFYAAGLTDWQRYLWNRMFKKSVIKKHNIHFQENIFYKEDGLFVVQYLCASNGVVACVDKVLYYYFRNTTGAMSKTWHAFDDKLITNLEAHRQMIAEMRMREVSEIVIKKAIEQAKAACNWINTLMYQSKSFSIKLLYRIEKTMVSILGIRNYIVWRTSQLGKLVR